ncbi:hypothetical protein INQ54_17055 [Lysinibacillus sphaericus]|nr:hypothetical protein [Bacillus thuringiensis]QPA52265.1 hypothetical protein INQ54_17055 [Lysinibacillus sphaericus]
MNLYSQDGHYFGTDEAYSFHIGIMLRMMDAEINKPERFVEYISNGNELSVSLSRKLILAREKLESAIEIEEIQAIGVMCRETLIELIGNIFDPTFLEEGQEPFKKSDVKNQGQVVINKFLSGSENAELRKHIKNLLNGAWDYANIITHSSSRTIQEASVCLTMTAAVVSSFEDLLDKFYDPIAGLKCEKCGSKKLLVAENDETTDLLIICENCSYGFLKKD